MEHGPTTTKSRGSRRSRMARTISREWYTVSAARAVSGSRRLTSSGVANKSLEATLTFCNRSWISDTATGTSGRDGGLHGPSDGPQLREKLELERLGEVGDPAGAACAGLAADDALHGLHVRESPQLELVVEVDQALRELVQVPILDRVVVHAEPGLRHLLARLIGLGEVAVHRLSGNREPAPAEEA